MSYARFGTGEGALVDGPPGDPGYPTIRQGLMQKIRKLLVANRSEIAIRVFRTAHELGIRTVAIYSHEDRYALHRFKADESYLVGKQGEPIRAYLAIDNIIDKRGQHRGT